MTNATILIAGAGPVGLTAACVMAHLGVPVTVIDKSPTPTRHPKMDITNARSMELFRKYGLEDALRAVAVPDTHPFDVSWITTLAGYELHRFNYKSPAELRTQYREINDGTQPQVPPMRVSQVEIEPVLRKAAVENPLITERFGVAIEGLEQGPDGVVATLRDQETGETEQIGCDYLVGCDGGNSVVRQALDIGLEGEADLGERFMIHFHSRDRDLLQRFGIAWHYQSSRGSMIAQNDDDIWTLHTMPGPDPDGYMPTPEERLVRYTGREFNFDIKVANPWRPHLLVAEKYGQGNVFLAGDAAHQYIPTGGYGMNTGVGDAVDIGWKLAAVAKGYGGSGLLASYDLERRPVGVRNRGGSGRHAGVRMDIQAVYAEEFPSDIEGDEDRRARAAQRIAALGNAENESWGIEYGYAYPDSPVICGEADAEISTDPVRYVPTTAPGARLPSCYLRDGAALFDRLGPWFTLISFAGAPETAWGEAAEKISVPLAVLTLDEPDLGRIYGADLILVRPDHHVVWRGRNNGAPVPPKILKTALGR